MTQINEALEKLCINTIRTLSMDGVEAAKSGHPGMPMGMAPGAYLLYTKYLRHNPKNMNWPNRDRFILSAGHGSMLLYSILHLTGYDLPLDELKRFRKLHSKTPGHPEYGLTDGVETTTGPLGQGFGNGIGMAIAQKHLETYFNRPDYPIFNYRIFAIVSDGDLMEGISSEAASLAGHLRLDNIIYIYDDNDITIDGPTSLSFSEDVTARFISYGWHVENADGNDVRSLDTAIQNCLKVKDKPSIIRAKTIIGFGSPNKKGTAEVHGAPLGEEELKLTKKELGFDPEKNFHIPEDVLAYFRQSVEKGKGIEEEWNKMVKGYKDKHPQLYERLMQYIKGDLPVDWKSILPEFTPKDGKLATRQASGKTIEKLIPAHPFVIGGSADLAPSNNTKWKNAQPFSADNRLGRYIHYGIREHAMGSIMNGLALSKLRPYGGTFLIFSDYMRPTIRLAALMELPVVYVFTHDSIGIGEDGPTHQPVEHIAALRVIPNVRVIRPADAGETAYAWKLAMERKNGPTVLALTRQGLPVIDRTKYAPVTSIEKGGYVLADSENPKIILIASGSEVQHALEAYEELKKEGVAVRVVNMAVWDLFDEQDDKYKESVLPAKVTARIAIEAGISFGWSKYVGEKGKTISVDRFGESAPVNEIMREFGFTAENVIRQVKEMLKI